MLTTLVKFKPRLLARCQTLLPDVLMRAKIEFSEKKKQDFTFALNRPALRTTVKIYKLNLVEWTGAAATSAAGKSAGIF